MIFKKYQLRSYNFRLVALIIITCVYVHGEKQPRDIKG